MLVLKAAYSFNQKKHQTPPKFFGLVYTLKYAKLNTLFNAFQNISTTSV